MSWYIEGLKKYSVFTGRAGRQEYWYFVLFSTLISIALAIVDAVADTTIGDGGTGLFGSFYGLAVALPGLGVTVRRLHDTGRSGWRILIALVPVAGPIILLVYLAQASRNANQYGTMPSGVPA